MMLPAALWEAAEPPPATKPLVAKLPMTAVEPLSLLLRVHFEGLLLVAESDMIVEGGQCVGNLSKG